MTSRTDLDRVIGAWLGDGPTAAPDGVVDRAVATTDRVRQRPARDSGIHLGSVHVTFDPVGVAVIAIALVVMTTAIGIGTGVIPLPAPDWGPANSPSAAPSASEEPRASEAASSRMQRFIAPGGFFSIELPEPWHRYDGPDASALYLTDSPAARFEGRYSLGYTWLTIRHGEVGGSVRTCDEAPVEWERCTDVEGVNLDELAEGVGIGRSTTADGGFTNLGPWAAGFTLDGVPVRVVTKTDMARATPSMRYPVEVKYVLAIHDGEPYLVRLAQGPAAFPMTTAIDRSRPGNAVGRRGRARIALPFESP